MHGSSRHCITSPLTLFTTPFVTFCFAVFPGIVWNSNGLPWGGGRKWPLSCIKGVPQGSFGIPSRPVGFMGWDLRDWKPLFFPVSSPSGSILILGAVHSSFSELPMQKPFDSRHWTPTKVVNLNLTLMMRLVRFSCWYCRVLLGCWLLKIICVSTRWKDERANYTHNNQDRPLCMKWGPGVFRSNLLRKYSWLFFSGIYKKDILLASIQNFWFKTRTKENSLIRKGMKRNIPNGKGFIEDGKKLHK